MKKLKIGKSTFYQQDTIAGKNWMYIKDKAKIILEGAILAFILYIFMIFLSIL